VRLATDTLDRLAPEVERFGYDREAQRTGIVHFGIGAFHRAHQAWYTDRALEAGDRDWLITGVSLRSSTVAEQMNPQDGLYTLTERSSAGDSTRLIGAVRGVLVASRSAAAVVERLAAPATGIVTFTVTEKGYCRAADGSLSLDLAGQGSFYPLLAEAFRQRRAGGLAGLTLLSCDNLADNGTQLSELITQYLSAHGTDLASWFEAECGCPSTMVDRIVPATTEADRAELAARAGLEDAAAVFTEPFSQWVIEDRFAGARPAWERVGAQLVADVAPYELAKLRMLNGAHSALAYLGLGRGHAYVHQAIADPALRPQIERLMSAEAARSFVPAPGQDLDAYARALLDRFGNPALNHRLSQIAMDGSQKIPQRWLAVLASQQIGGQPCEAILAALGAWLRHIRGDNGAVDDPLASQLKSAWSRAGEQGIVPALFGENGLLASDWRPSDRDRAVLEASVRGAWTGQA
jgi:fructuronate reductase